MTDQRKNLVDLIMKKFEDAIVDIGTSPHPNLCVKHTKFLHCLWVFEKIAQARMEDEIDWRNIISRLKDIYTKITTLNLNLDYRTRLLHIIQSLEFYLSRGQWQYTRKASSLPELIFTSLDDLLKDLDVQHETEELKLVPTELDCCMWVVGLLPKTELSEHVKKELVEKLDSLLKKLRQLASYEKFLDDILIKMGE